MTDSTGKRERNKARKRAAIVEVATSSFFEQGYATTSMSAIAEELGCSKATLWSHFPSKEALFEAVIDAQVEVFSRDIDETLTSQTFTLASLRRASQRFLDSLLRQRSIELFRLVLSEGERFPEINEVFYQRGPAKVRVFICDFFTTAFTPDDAERLALTYIAALTGYRSDILLRPVKPTHAERDAFIDNLISIIDWPAHKDGKEI